MAELSSEIVAVPIVGLVNLALHQNERAGICEVLRWIAEATQSCGAVLWEPDPDIPTEHPSARLFTAGHWFRSGRRFAAHDLLMAKSLAGAAIRDKHTRTANDVLTDSRTAKSQAAKRMFKDHNITACRAAPVHFGEGGTGAIAVFRKYGDPPYTKEGEYLLWQFCELLPGLHESLHHSVSFALIDEVKDILQSAEDRSETLPDTWVAVCKAIQKRFRLLEASVFLEDPANRPGEFHLAGTTCERYIGQRMYKANQSGLTSWAITEGAPIRIWDLRYFHRREEKALIESLHPGVIWRDPIQAEKTTAELLDLEIADLPPLSFIAQPILSGPKICGVMRCCTAIEAPFYFTHRERALLAVIASQLGQYWTRWLDRRTVREENQAWSKLVDSIKGLNYSVNSELRRQAPDVLNVFRKGLDATADLVPGGEIMDIRLVDEKKDQLYFAFTHGEAWTDEKRQKRYSPRKKPPDSAGSAAFQSGRMEIIPDVKTHPYYKEMFSGVKSMMIAPIRSENKVYGVIDIRNFGSGQFASYAQQMAELLGQQLGLYHELIDTVGSLRAAEQQLKEQTRISEQAFADWQHQIRGPINQAYVRLQDIIHFVFADYDSTPQYLKVQRGLLGKSKRASRTLRLFLDLAKQQSPKLNLRQIDPSALVKLLVETCLDNRVLAPRRRSVDFTVNAPSFSVPQAGVLYADEDLLEQAVNNIVDNAFKYSYPRTMIEVTGSKSGSYFCISVSNEGIPLHEGDLINVGTRGWRGPDASGVVGEGSGIGLWAVDHIMRAHNGRLTALPTTRGRTEFRLFFPCM